MNNIIIDLQNNGYNIEKNNDIIRVKVDSDMFFEININSFEIIKRERNYGQTFGVYQSLDECLIMLYFTLLSSKINNDSLDFEKKIENTNDLQTIYSLFVEKYGKDYVDKNIFFNKKIEDVNGFCLTSHFEEYNGYIVYFDANE